MVPLGEEKLPRSLMGLDRCPLIAANANACA